MFDAMQQLQRPGLALANGTVYIGFASHGDMGNWHGWFFGYDASNLQRQASALNLSPDGYGAGIWQSGRAPAVDRDGNLYVSTGNGDFDGIRNFGESVLKLSGSDLSVLNLFTPQDWSDLNDTDWDVGSTGVALLPGTNKAVLGGKSGDMYVLDGWLTNQPGAGTGGVTSVHISDNQMFNFAVWDTTGGATVFAQEPWFSLKALRLTDGQIDPTPLSEFTPPAETLYSGIAVSANGNDQASGILWVTVGNFDVSGVPGTLHALNASDLSVELWNSDMVPDRDTLGRFAKFIPPVVANGRVYIATFSNALAIYGLLADSQNDTPAPQVTSVVNGASYLGGAVAPGEVVALFGSALGPAESAGTQLDDNGNVSSYLADTQVFFDGVSAPLLYVSATQIVAVVPFGVVGPVTEVVVLENGRLSNAVDVPVASAAPGLFSADGTGGDQGAILDEDGTPNSFLAPATRGSIVSLYATGIGRTDPDGVDGQVTAASNAAIPLLPVHVLINNQPAPLVHAGMAPGTVEGVFQIQVRIPQEAIAGSNDVLVQAGDYSSPSTVSVYVQ